MSKRKVSAKRAKALDHALMASRLLEEEYYDDVMAAVAAQDREKFLSICEKANVPEDVAISLWGYAEVYQKGFPGVW